MIGAHSSSPRLALAVGLSCTLAASCNALSGVDDLSIASQRAATSDGSPPPADGNDGGPELADADTPIPSEPSCDLDAPFGAPELVSVSTQDYDETAFVSADESSIYVSSGKDERNLDLYLATRPAPDAAFGPLVALTGLNGSGNDTMPSLTSDGLTLYFARGTGAYDILVSKRASIAATFETAAPLTNLNTTSSELDPWVMPDGKALYFSSDRGGSLDLYRVELGPTGASSPIALAELNTGETEGTPVVTADELTIYFGRATRGGVWEIWMARRARATDPFGPPRLVTWVTDIGTDHWPSWTSRDGCTLYFASLRSGGPGKSDLWRATHGR